MGTAGEYSGVGGCQPKGLGDVSQGGGTCSAAIRVGDVGADPLHGTVLGKLPTRGCMKNNGEKVDDMGGGGLGTTTAGGRDGGGGI